MVILRRGFPRGWQTPLLLLGVVILSYGLWIPWMGLFGDDLSYLYYDHLLGPWGPGLFASIDRPVSALFYAVSMAVLGETVLPYHVFLLVLRWLSAVLLWWVLGLVWPNHKWEATLAALLFAVYPGFRQNPIALEFILHFFVLDLFLLSLGTMLLAYWQFGKGSRRLFWAYTLLTALGAAGVFSLEYFVGLEILRPILLWLVTRRDGLRGKQQWQRILVCWAAPLVVLLAFLIWRVFIFSFPTYKPTLLNELRTQPLAALVDLTKSAARDCWTALGAAWLQTLQAVRILSQGRMLLVYLALAAVSAALVGWFGWRLVRAQSADSARWDGKWALGLLGLGLLCMLAGGSIFWVTGIPIELSFPWDRSTLALMLGASLTVTGVLALLPRQVNLALVSLLVALAVGLHFVNALEYRAELNKMRDFFWQLAWRAPQLEPGTLALFDVIPLNRYSDNDLTAMLNWTYGPEQHSRQVAYKFFDLTLRFNQEESGLPGLEKGLPVEHNHRGLFFKTTTSSTLALEYNPPACLKVLGAEDALRSNLPERLAAVLPMTNINQIQVNAEPASPPWQLGQETEHGWCYYYQKADLARQQGNWSAAAGLGDEVFKTQLHPADPIELMPFIQGYIHTGNLERARALSEEALKEQDLKPLVCSAWKQALAADISLQQSASGMVNGFGCGS